MAELKELFEEIDQNHSAEPCADEYEIDRLENGLEYELPEDLKAFYRRYSTVWLFNTDCDGATYRFVPISQIHPTRIDILGSNHENWGPVSWLTVCDVQDGNYVAVDLESKRGDVCNYIDCFHETFAVPGECEIVARSFTELLERALHSGGDQLYYLQSSGFRGYGDGRELTAANATMRIESPEAQSNGWLMQFTLNHVPHSRFFGDVEYGGKQEAFEAVTKYIEESRRA